MGTREFSAEQLEHPDVVPAAVGRGANVALVVRVVARRFNNTIAGILGPERFKSVALARHVAMFVARRKVRDVSFPELGKEFGNRDHTTVISAVKRIRRLVEADPDFRLRVAEVERELDELCGGAQ